MVCGLLVLFGVWRSAFAVACLVFGVWCLGVWCLVFGVWCLVFGVWCVGVRCLSLCCFVVVLLVCWSLLVVRCLLCVDCCVLSVA